MKGEFTQKGKEALERFKMESANEVGVTLNKGYNGDLTSRQAGSIGGQMVNMICPEQQFNFDRPSRWETGHMRHLSFEMQVGV
ncbi:MAG: alpha/beta-type small acid-soluble spore protein [Oscillospiraceae bacterium]|nr:alpha/beta-type small acid-soluble spore protein [Oscillospiraceae bacterium]